ncbi:MAG: hypothetical protein HUJ53_00880 [Holdemanella sp.]|nr:hypothetical protein [Holdemanella sp.]
MAKRKMRLKVTKNISSTALTVLLSAVLILNIAILWSLFISGPSRIHEEEINSKMVLIQKKNKEIKGLTRHVFDYITYQGYDNATLYWFDANGDVITTREMMDLDYDKAKKIAKEDYGIDCVTIQLAYGYNNPCYEIKGKDKVILIDFDTFVRVYERGL